MLSSDDCELSPINQHDMDTYGLHLSDVDMGEGPDWGGEGGRWEGAWHSHAAIGDEEMEMYDGEEEGYNGTDNHGLGDGNGNKKDYNDSEDNHEDEDDLEDNHEDEDDHKDDHNHEDEDDLKDNLKDEDESNQDSQLDYQDNADSDFGMPTASESGSVNEDRNLDSLDSDHQQWSDTDSDVQDAYHEVSYLPPPPVLGSDMALAVGRVCRDAVIPVESAQFCHIKMCKLSAETNLAANTYKKLCYTFLKELGLPSHKVLNHEMRGLSDVKLKAYDCCVNSCICYAGAYADASIC
ncbi:hypothetical protein FRB94_010075 [Tulasnella sp. JGI-2019a]|nr:hypothetical protein FRB94_010075 [Tulasnella sp. JGI-2019a]